jgi:hydrogenase expression/formation protein HypC
MCLGVPGCIVRTVDDHGLRMGTVDFAGIRREVCLAYVPEAGVGDYVVVHAGFAISQIDAAAAATTLALLAEIGDAELAALRGAGV